MQGLLLEEGIPSLVRRSGGFDVPDFLAAGPRDILVPAAGADAARDPAPGRPPSRRPPARARRMGTRAGRRLAVVILALVAAGVYAAIV